MSSNKCSLLLISDIIDDLFNENKRLFKQLLFADKCLKMFCEFKTFIELNSHKFVNNFDSFDKQKYNMFIENISELEKDMELDVRQETTEVEEVDQRSDHRLDNEMNVQKERSKKEMCEQSEDEVKSRSFVCGINGCDKRYSKSKSLDSHQRLVHNNPILICSHPDCGYETRNKCQMKYHESVHLAERPFKCTVDGCGKSAISQQNLNSHMTIVHSIGRNFKCTHEGCGSAFNCQTSLNGHYRAKHGEKRLTCSWPGCDYRCVSSNTLVLHRRVHSDERQFACDWPKCQYKSKWSNTLNKHKKSVHLKEKPYSCHWPGCEYTGTRKNFRRHYKCHSNERNYYLSCRTMKTAFENIQFSLVIQHLLEKLI